MTTANGLADVRKPMRQEPVPLLLKKKGKKDGFFFFFFFF